MAQTINTNVMSLTAQRNLNRTNGAMATAVQRLSSGLRVNSAKDDAAGLAIAERMNTQVRGLTVAARNANDGISLAQTAEGSLGNVGDMLQRMRELAVQSANATNSASDRKALDAEVQQLKAEIDRVATQTSFNGTKLLDGSFSSQVFQVGANGGEAIAISEVVDVRTESLGVSSRAELESDAVAEPATGDVLAEMAAGAITFTLPDASTVEVGAIGEAESASERRSQLMNAINKVSGESGVTAYIDAEAGTLKLVSADDIAVAGDYFTTNTSATAADTAGMIGINVQDQYASSMALETIDAALQEINGTRANLGALQSRFENAVTNIQITSENLAAARGRIVDADFAAETAAMTRAQILTQAGTAMVAQANAAPQSVLSLLG